MKINAALANFSGLPLAHLTLGEIDVYGGDYLKAVQEFRRTGSGPGVRDSLDAFGTCIGGCSATMNRSRFLRRSISVDSSAPEPYVVMGKVLLRAGQPDLAEKQFASRHPSGSSSYTAHYFLAQLYVSKENWKPPSAK